MKKIKALLIGCFALCTYTAQAQHNLTITNNAPCQICFTLMGAEGPIKCIPVAAQTGVICIPPGTTMTFANPAAASFTPPLTATGFFMGACVYNYNPSTTCAGNPLTQVCIFNECAGGPPLDRIEIFNDCESCTTATIRWEDNNTIMIN